MARKVGWKRCLNCVVLQPREGSSSLSPYDFAVALTHRREKRSCGDDTCEHSLLNDPCWS